MLIALDLDRLLMEVKSRRIKLGKLGIKKLIPKFRRQTYFCNGQ